MPYSLNYTNFIDIVAWIVVKAIKMVVVVVLLVFGPI